MKYEKNIIINVKIKKIKQHEIVFSKKLNYTV